MSTNQPKLLSGRVPVVPYDDLTSDRYEFLGLGQAEPSLGAGTANSVLVLGSANTRVWSNTISLVSISTSGNISASGNIRSGNLSVTGNIRAGNISVTGNVSANYYTGNGSLLTGLLTTVSNVVNGATIIDIATADGNIAMTVSGVGNIVVVSTTGQEILGNLGVSGTVQTSQISVSGKVSVVGNISGSYIIGNGSQLTGVIGAQGPAGPSGGGTQGIQGPTGIQGPVGVQGVQGVQGRQGTTGAQGTQGIEGAQGAQGTTGAQGTQGVQGRQGITGAQGSTGLQGTQGVQGIQGLGTQGTQGVQGLIGAGTQGTQGTQGITGAGTQGTVGAQGVQGIQGVIGLGYGNVTSTTSATPASSGTITLITNQQGAYITGDRIRAVNTVSNLFEGTVTITGGTTFAIAADYNIGSTTASSWTISIAGVRGAQGLQGITGPQGIQGIQGIFGTQGIQGVQGPQGTQGIQGVLGTQGTQGTQGFGVQGAIGAGAQGIQGVQGVQGTQGVQGIPGPGTNINAVTSAASGTFYPVMVSGTGGATAVIDNSGSIAAGTALSYDVANSVLSTTSLYALYADLAECYLADHDYDPGTVISFGGNQEVTMSTVDNDSRIAGVISTKPAYKMNSGLIGDNVVAIALQGRVPCLVLGPVSAGDLMVSAGNGRARSENNPARGAVIGKAIKSFDGDIGTIEIVVGRV
jgi:hypothetical protein